MMTLSKRAEDLLAEILLHRDSQGNCDVQFWKTRFKLLENAEEVVLRSHFKELIETEMITVGWADNVPYYMFILGNGIAYFEEKREMNEEQNIRTSTNNFYGPVNNIQIQQGTMNSTQNQTISEILNEAKIDELIQTIKKYDNILETEYGVEEADNLREAVDELTNIYTKPDETKKTKTLLAFIRDLSVNAGGGLVAAGIVQLIKIIMG